MPKLTARSSLLTVCLLFFTLHAFTQRSISGKVTGSNNEPISGATVSVKGTTIATQTNAEGTFTISAPNDKSTLVVTNVGFENMEIIANGRGLLNVVLK